MTADILLLRLEALHDDMMQKQDQHDKLCESLSKSTTCYPEGGAVASSLDPHRIEEKLGLCERLRNELLEDSIVLTSLEAKADELIERIPDPSCRLLLQLRYLCFKSWKSIAHTMSYSERHTYRMQKKAMKLASQIEVEADADEDA